MARPVDPGLIAVLSLAGSLSILIGWALPFSTSTAADLRAASIAVIDYRDTWADELTAPRTYIADARREVDRHHYVAAARNIRKAAVMVSQHESYAAGRERARLHIAVMALRLTAKDVAAGAVTGAAQLDAVLNDTHNDLLARHPLSP